MTVAIIIAVLGVTILGLVLAARWWHMDDWRRSLVAYRLYPPAGMTPDETAAWLAGISATTHPTRYALLPLPPVAVETVATPAAIEHYALVRKHDQQRLLSGLRAALPGVRIGAVPDYLRTRPMFRVAAELTMTTQARPLQEAARCSTGTWPAWRGVLLLLLHWPAEGHLRPPLHACRGAGRSCCPALRRRRAPARNDPGTDSSGRR